MTSWQSRVYEVDKGVAEICRDMQLRGFCYDLERAAVLSEALTKVEEKAASAAFEAAGCEPFNINSTRKLWTCFRELGAPILFRSALTGNPSLGVDAMRAYSAARDRRIAGLAASVLEWRRARKVRRVYIDGIKVNPCTGRVHPSWLSYGAVSGRLACQGPNLMNIVHPTRDPVIKLGGIRSLYRAAPGYRLVSFDMAQLEMRIAAYASGDDIMIASCESGDLHAANAFIIWPEAFSPESYAALNALSTRDEAQAALFKELKFLRQLAKTAGFAVCYLAEAETVYAKIVSEGAKIRLREVESMLNRMKRRFRAYYAWQNARLLDCMRTGYVESPIAGRRRHLGHSPKPTEAANFPIQSGAADLMNTRSVELISEIRRLRLQAFPVAQVHDNLVLETVEADVERVSELCYEVFERPCEMKSSGRLLAPSFPIDLEVIDRWN